MVPLALKNPFGVWSINFYLVCFILFYYTLLYFISFYFYLFLVIVNKDSGEDRTVVMWRARVQPQGANLDFGLVWFGSARSIPFRPMLVLFCFVLFCLLSFFFFPFFSFRFVSFRVYVVFTNSAPCQFSCDIPIVNITYP